MPHDPELVAETRAWFEKAAEDIRAGQVDLGAQPPLLADSAYHAQQAAEKAMKGFLFLTLQDLGRGTVEQEVIHPVSHGGISVQPDGFSSVFFGTRAWFRTSSMRVTGVSLTLSRM